MRIHLQNPRGTPLFDFSLAMWDAASVRAGEIGRGHAVSLGVTPADFVAGMRDAEALVTDASVIKALFPCEAPRLRLIFLTNAGLDGLAPFTWLPRRGVDEQPRDTRREIRRVRPSWHPDAGQSRSAR